MQPLFLPLFTPGWSSDEDSSSPLKNDQDGCFSQDKPHLLFRITSDDGFSVEADSIEGKKPILPCYGISNTKVLFKCLLNADVLFTVEILSGLL